MTLKEKIQQMLYYSEAVERLDIKKYNWWNECLHGVARAGTVTVFPQAIGMAASFNKKLLHRVAETIADEARAKYNEFVKHDEREIYKGLTFWTPNLNIFRDPRWGSGQEKLNIIAQKASAILEVWYAGEEGGNAAADIIFEDYNLAGRLPVTFINSIEQLPPFRN